MCGSTIVSIDGDGGLGDDMAEPTMSMISEGMVVSVVLVVAEGLVVRYATSFTTTSMADFQSQILRMIK